mmetsp:Transcript_31945/g.96580  ORF Transcript_31945/g.96580 Transcript_31945/m.96580 type:complete len:233 (+) Transcript_31945:1122-1820(+)
MITNSPTMSSSSAGGKCSTIRSIRGLWMGCFAASAARPANSLTRKRSVFRGGNSATHLCKMALAPGDAELSHKCPSNCWTIASLPSSSTVSKALSNNWQPPALTANSRANATNHSNMETCWPKRASNERFMCRPQIKPSRLNSIVLCKSQVKGLLVANIGMRGKRWVPETRIKNWARKGSCNSKVIMCARKSGMMALTLPYQLATNSMPCSSKSMSSHVAHASKERRPKIVC